MWAYNGGANYMNKAQKDDPRRRANCTNFYQHYFMPKYQE